jgi:putative membrane protein
VLINNKAKTNKEQFKSFNTMKTTKIKASLFILLLSASLFGFTSCENKESHQAEEKHSEVKTEEVAKEQNDAKFNENAEQDNAKFLVKAAEINLEEISLGKLAEEKSTHADVKALAKMMVTAHTKASEELKGLAAKKSISIPAENTQDIKDAYQKLSDKKDQKDFDKAYVDMMVDGHKNAITLFEKESTESSDADIKAWATSMLPELRKHLDHAIVVQEKCKKM